MGLVRCVKALCREARVAGIASGAALLAAACAPATAPCIARGGRPMAFLSAPSSPTGAAADTGLDKLIRNPPASVAGERLNVGLLRPFYARRNFEPVWTSRQSQADSLVKAI